MKNNEMWGSIYSIVKRGGFANKRNEGVIKKIKILAIGNQPVRRLRKIIFFTHCHVATCDWWIFFFGSSQNGQIF